MHGELERPGRRTRGARGRPGRHQQPEAVRGGSRGGAKAGRRPVLFFTPNLSTKSTDRKERQPWQPGLPIQPEPIASHGPSA